MPVQASALMHIFSKNANSILTTRASSSLKNASAVGIRTSLCRMKKALFSSQASSNDFNFAEEDAGSLKEAALSSNVTNTSHSLEQAQVDPFADILDPENPPRLTYAHYRLLKSIDYTPLVQETNEMQQTLQRGLEIARAKLNYDLPPEQEDTIINADGIRAGDVSTQSAYSIAQAMKKKSATEDEIIREGDITSEKKKKAPCAICIAEKEYPQAVIEWTNVNFLRQFINERGMITHRKNNFNCGRHQRQVTNSIQRARFMGLLCPTSDWAVPLTWVYPELLTQEQQEQQLIREAAEQAAAQSSSDAEASSEEGEASEGNK
jgi:small subunit ribosomal protein S18